MTTHSLPRYTLGEEIANSITHGIGTALSIAGLAILTAFASVHGDAWHIVSVSIFGATLILLYTCSTLYHSVTHPRAKQVFRFLDHAAIYLLIAGTYTPFALVNLRGPWGWSFFGVAWGIAILGICLQGPLLRRKAYLSVALYVAMGWIVVFGFQQMLAAIPFGGVALIFAGGFCYTFGSVFYLWRRLRYHHAIWHLFVLAGSVLHFFAVLFYVIPLAG